MLPAETTSFATVTKKAIVEVMSHCTSKLKEIKEFMRKLFSHKVKPYILHLNYESFNKSFTFKIN